MSSHLNPNTDAFLEKRGTRHYEDKHLTTKKPNTLVCTKDLFICASYSRNFGVSMSQSVNSAYYTTDRDTCEVLSHIP
jgi:hypothetical protein